MVVRELINLIGFRMNQSQLRQVEAGVDRISNRMRNFGFNATLWLTAPFVGLNIWLAKTLSGFEQMEVAFETMLGSVEKSDKLITDMLNFAAKTPFEVKNIGNVVKQLLATGSSAEMVLDDLRLLGNAASGLSVPIQRLALNFGQVRAQGKLTGRDLKDFTIAGINMRKELQKIVGAGVDVDKMVSKGEISFETMRKVFENMSAEGGIFYNLMIRQSKTLGGLWSNFKDIIVLSARDFEKELLPVFKKIVLSLIKLVGMFKNDVTPNMKRMIYFLGAFLAILGPLALALSVLIGIGKAVASTFLFISTAARAANMSTMLFLGKFALIGLAVIALIALVIFGIDEIISHIKGGNTILGLFLDFLEKVNKKLMSMGIFTFNFIKGIIKDIRKSFELLFQFIIQLFTKKWKDALSTFVKLAATYLKILLKTSLSFIQPILDLINLIFKTTFDFGGLLDNIISKLETLASKVPGFLTKSPKAIKDFLTWTGEVGKEASKGFTRGITPSFMQTNAPNMSTEINVNVPPGTPEQIAENVGQTIKKVVTGVINNQVRFMSYSLPEVE